MTRKLLLPYVVAVFALATAAAQTPQQEQQARSVIPDATLAAHANLYATRRPNLIVSRDKDGKLQQLKTESFGEPFTNSYESQLPSYPSLELLRLACQADTIVVATAGESRSALTPSGHFVYSDVFFRVSSVIKGASGDKIIVTRPGGTISVAGQSIAVDVDRFPPFVPGTEYVLFLLNLPSSPDTFIADKHGSIVLSPTITRLGGERFSDNSLSAFLGEVRAAVTSSVSCSSLAKEIGGDQ